MVGSVAAAWQSSIGAVSAGSLFTFLQSAGIGGTAAALFVGGGLAETLVAIGATAVAALKKVRDNVSSFWGSLTRGLCRQD